MKGKLVVIDGIDGSGKTTQIELLKKYLASQGVTLQVVSFPQYGQNEYADKIYEYLSGKLGEIEIHELAKIYADDRKTVRDKILGWLESGQLVIANRYISSSKAHLGAKLTDEKREEFIKWVDKLEYEINGMPKEGLAILLDVNPKIGQENSQDKNHPDIHEDNLKHLEKARQIFLELAKDKNWIVMECMKDGQMRTPEEINSHLKKVILENKVS